MEYSEFWRVTERHAVVVNGWPNGVTFQSPHHMPTREQVSLVHRAFETGTARFEKLTPEEHAKWENDRFEALLREQEGGGDSGDVDEAPTAGPTTGQKRPAPDDDEEHRASLGG